MPRGRDANEKIVAGKLNGCFGFFRSHQVVTTSESQEKNNMLVFKTPMNCLRTAGCNQITKLRSRSTLFFGNRRLLPENHNNIPNYSPVPPLKLAHHLMC